MSFAELLVLGATLFGPAWPGRPGWGANPRLRPKGRGGGLSAAEPTRCRRSQRVAARRREPGASTVVAADDSQCGAVLGARPGCRVVGRPESRPLRPRPRPERWSSQKSEVTQVFSRRAARSSSRPRKPSGASGNGSRAAAPGRCRSRPSAGPSLSNAKRQPSSTVDAPKPRFASSASSAQASQGQGKGLLARATHLGRSETLRERRSADFPRSSKSLTVRRSRRNAAAMNGASCDVR